MTVPAPVHNRLLGSLPPDCLARVAPLLTRVALRKGEVLIAPGQSAEDVFFIEGGLVSLVAGPDMPGVEVGVTGREGLVGVSALLDSRATSPFAVFVVMEGSALRMRGTALRELAEQLPPLREACLRFVHRLLAHMAATAAHNVSHSVPARCARWLIAAHEQVGGGELRVTHDLLAGLLNVRRSGVTVTLARFERLGLVRSRRGRISVLDPPALAELAAGRVRPAPPVARISLPVEAVGKLVLFSERLRSIRHEFGLLVGSPGLTAGEFAARLGLPLAAYQPYERGERRPDLFFLVLLHRRTGISIGRRMVEPSLNS